MNNKIYFSICKVLVCFRSRDKSLLVSGLEQLKKEKLKEIQEIKGDFTFYVGMVVVEG